MDENKNMDYAEKIKDIEKAGLLEDEKLSEKVENENKDEKKENKLDDINLGIKTDNFLESPIVIQLFQNSNIIHENRGVVTGDNTQMRDWSIVNEIAKDNRGQNKEKKYGSIVDIEIWIKEHFGQYIMAEMISLAVFNDMPYLWIHSNAKSLFEKSQWKKEEEHTMVVNKDEVLRTLGAISYKGYIVSNGGKMETEFVAFESSAIAEQVLLYIWEQYIDYRAILMDWAKVYLLQANYSQSQASLQAISVWAKNDFGYFEGRFLNSLIKRECLAKTAELLHLLAKEEHLMKNIKMKALHWGTLQGCDYILLSLLVLQKEGWDCDAVISRYFSQMVREIENGYCNEYIKNIVDMYAIGQRKGNYYKSIVQALYSYKEKQKGRYPSERKDALDCIFYILLQCDIEYANICKKEMILVRMLFIKNEYSDYLQVLWKSLWRNRRIYRLAKDLIAQYWKEQLLQDDENKKKMNAFYQMISGNSE